ncbi:sulfotransferase domain-containing protein [Solicola gregarius]|uniref:Sulfotransferase n=1 Tax=Solicola gregarius TaxID=2908642 RepID=A0AA46YNH0_9ACTN|nr:sulfotransferase domain-containing protein [Solicola gregarius]UYM07451.1 sulfotransferase [Solicola gregarius]
MHRGPAWLGIGAQRSGTTWLTDLLVQHPDVGVGTNGKKEQQALQRIARGRLDEGDYLAQFPDDGLRRGDFTPRYLNNASVPAVASRLLPDGAPIVVILRDPVERLASGLRRRVKYPRHAWPYEAALAYGQWCGMYAPQLDLWAGVVGAERIRVYTYEAVRHDPAPACADIWGAVGLPPAPLTEVSAPSSSSAGEFVWEWPDGLQAAVTALYRPQLDELAERWGVRTDLWPNFAETS